MVKMYSKIKWMVKLEQQNLNGKIWVAKFGGIDKGSMYIWYVPVFHANVHACTTFRHGLYNSIVSAPTTKGKFWVLFQPS